MNSSDNIFRRFAVVAAVVATFLLFGASGAQAASTEVLAASGPLAAQEHDTGDEEEDPSDEETEDPDNEEDSDDEDSDDEDSDEETDEPTDEPTEQPTFTEPTDSTDDITEMPTEDAGATSEEGPSPLGWILLAGGVASAAAAFLVYRRNRPL